MDLELGVLNIALRSQVGEKSLLHLNECAEVDEKVRLGFVSRYRDG